MAKRGTIGDWTPAKLKKYIGDNSSGSPPGGSDTEIQYNDSGSFGGISQFTWDDADLKIADDTKLYFGTNSDAHIEYDEDGSDYLIISGSNDGILLSGTMVRVAGHLAQFEVQPYPLFAPSLYADFNNVTIGQVSQFTANSTFYDNNKLYFGTGQESHIQYRESSDDFMVISGSDAGLVLSGSQLVLDTTTVTSGSIAGLGSYLGVTSTGQVVLTSSAGGGGGGVTNPLADDTKLYFGSDSDSYIEYDSSADLMVISGSSTGVVLSGSTIVLTASNGGVSINAEGGAGQDINITNTGGSVHIVSTEDIVNAISLTSNNIYFNGGDQDNAYLFYSKPLYLDVIATDPASPLGKLWSSPSYVLQWGGTGLEITGSGHFNKTGGDYDFQVQSNNETHKLFVSGGADCIGINQSSPDSTVGLDINDDALFTDDKKLYFGTGKDAFIEYDSSADKLIMSGAASGSYFSGSTISVGALGSGYSDFSPTLATPVSACDSITNMRSAAGTYNYGSAVGRLSNGQAGGEMIRIGAYDSGVTARGQIVSFSDVIGIAGYWFKTDRSITSPADGAGDKLIAVAMDYWGSGENYGLVLLRGTVRIPGSLMNNFTNAATDVGRPVYISTTAGEYDMDASSTSGDLVRIVGYMLDSDGTDHLIYFCPDNTWIEIT